MGSRVWTRRAYDAATRNDGYRVLVDRLWPRGVTKEEVSIDEWLRDVSPSDELRHWFGHDPDKWDEFRRRYRTELKGEPAASLEHLVDLAAKRRVTLVYGAKDTAHNNAVALTGFIEEALAKRR